METNAFTTSLLVDQTPEEVFEAVNNPQKWWPGEIAGGSQNINDEFSYRYEDFHYSLQKVIEMVPDQKVIWLVAESQLSFTEDIYEWTGTKIIFDISAEGDKTRLNFTHQGLVPEIECFGSCSGAWSRIIQQSLYSLITTGQGLQLSLT